MVIGRCFEHFTEISVIISHQTLEETFHISFFLLRMLYTFMRRYNSYVSEHPFAIPDKQNAANHFIAFSIFIESSKFEKLPLFCLLHSWLVVNMPRHHHHHHCVCSYSHGGHPAQLSGCVMVTGTTFTYFYCSYLAALCSLSSLCTYFCLLHGCWL